MAHVAGADAMLLDNVAGAQRDHPHRLALVGFADIELAELLLFPASVVADDSAELRP